MPMLPQLVWPPVNLQAASQRIAFLEKFAYAAPVLLSRDRPTPPVLTDREAPDVPTALPPPRVAPKPDILPAARALIEAAELAMAINESSKGMGLLLKALNLMRDQPLPDWPLARVALIGAILGEVETELAREGVWLRDVRGGRHEKLRYFDGARVAGVAGPLICAAIASGDALKHLRLLEGPAPDDPQARIAFLAAMTAPEMETLPAFGVARRDDGTIFADHGRVTEQRCAGLSALLAMHQRYAARVRALSSDPIRWQTLRLRASLLDWPLVAIHLALRRDTATISAQEFVDASRGAGAPNALAVFLQGLAAEISTGSTGLIAA